MRRILLASVAVSLVLAGCGGSDSDGGNSDKLSSVTVSDGKSPKVTVPQGFAVSKTSTDVLKDGGGDEVKAGDTVKVNYVAINGRTGKQFDSSFTRGTPITWKLAEPIFDGIIKGLEGQKVGSRVLVGVAPKDGFGVAQDQFDIKASDSLVFLFDVVSKVPTEVTGKAKSLPKDFPQLQLNDKNKPEGFKKTGRTASKKEAKESSAVVIEGKGAKVTAEQTVTVQYLGQVYPGGETFDESYTSGTPLTQPLSGLIKCWSDELVGKAVGSRVVLVCPADVAYGDQPPEGGAIKAGDTLLFAIDLLDAS